MTRGYKDEEVYDLPESLNEIRAANAALPNNQNLLLLGTRATESAFKRARLAEFGIIHLAVHGFASEKYPERSAVLLMADQNAGEDGFLQASEIVQLRLQAEVVVLSA